MRFAVKFALYAHLVYGFAYAKHTPCEEQSMCDYPNENAIAVRVWGFGVCMMFGVRKSLAVISSELYQQ